ncbi:DUF2516 family protein [Corynebacterium sp. HS2168-gen11]|uniref:DUF2516 family protein n=1 Tax=Corynebacterium sp. HS2168-gen11 TaxID=2974027 RepID=UPI00216B1297|nr:DUF2516 family protein [Corynebacterium sp. HS2168-gen11]MCS4535617.1 DUF2516 family protein [Corynebacterium sp. HS2168-gen11]
MSTVFLYAQIGINYLELAVYLGITIAGLVGAVLVMLTRDDAFEVAARKPKMTWAAILVGSAFAVGLQVLGLRLPFLPWIGMIVIGLYWFDVRPQINRILAGNFDW